jgi:hypothetical protein
MHLFLPFLAMLSGDVPPISQYLHETPEMVCVYDDMLKQATAGQHADADAGGERCKSQYGWTAHEAKVAVHIAWARIQFLQAMGEANEQKIDLDAIDSAFGELSVAQVRSVGWAEDKQDSPPPETLQAMMGQINQRFSDSAVKLKVLEVLLHQSAVKNAEDAFAALRQAD